MDRNLARRHGSARPPTAAVPRTRSPARMYTVNGAGDELPIQVPAADGKMRFWRNTASRSWRRARPRPWLRTRSASSGTPTSTTAARPAGLFDCRRQRTVATAVGDRRRTTVDATRANVDPQHHAVPGSRAAHWCSGPARSSGRGVSTPAHPTAPRPTSAHAAGNGQPARRHGRAARDAPGRPHRRDAVHRRRQPDVDDHVAGRRAPRCCDRQPRSRHRNRDRHRRRHRRRRRGVAPTTGRRGTRPAAATNWTYHVDAADDRVRSRIRARCRRRQRQPRRPCPASGHHQARMCPCTMFGAVGHARRRSMPGRCGRRVRGEVPRRRERLRHRRAVLQGVGEHGHAHREPVVVERARCWRR